MSAAEAASRVPGGVAPATPAWAGIIVRDLEASLAWYRDTLGCGLGDQGARWAVVTFPDGSAIELTVGDPARPGTAFPSYRDDDGPPVMPGFCVDEPAELARSFTVARWLPEWVVVVGPERLRVVLTCHRSDGARGLVGFRVRTPVVDDHRGWFDQLGAIVRVEAGPRLEVAPIVYGGADAELADPDGTAVVVAASRSPQDRSAARRPPA